MGREKEGVMSTSEQWNQRSEELAQEIRTIMSRVDDLSFDVLRQASRAKSGRPIADKKLMQARRALEKAAHLLAQPGFDDATHEPIHDE